ncbi:MAG: AAA domain-containing protein, partial [Bacteroidota bacterium]
MTTTSGPTSVFQTMAGVLDQELTLLNEGRRSMTMFHGERVGTFAGRTYYRFEIPEDLLLRSIESATFTFGRAKPISVPGNVISMENQFLVVALTQDFGSTIPEAQVSWDYEPQLGSVARLLRDLPQEALLPRLLLHPTDAANNHIVPFEPDVPPQTPADQVEALAKILCNRVTYLWGPILSGKTRVLALAAGNYLKAGKRVLFVAPSNDQVDAMLLRTVEIGGTFGVAMAETATRYDLPSLENVDALGSYAFDAQLESIRERKRQTFQERVTLLKTYWAVKVKTILHEDFYLKTQELRERVAELRRQADAAAKEAAQWQQQVNNVQNASILDRMKKGFSKDDLAAAQKALTDKQSAQKRLQQMHQNLTAEITKIELHAPVSGEETMSLNAAQKRIDELGGLDAVTRAVEDYTTIDEAML